MRLTTAGQTPLDRSGRLWDITSQMRELARDLRAEGFVEEAGSLDTTIRDLDWQSDALFGVKEQLTAFPSPRRFHPIGRIPGDEPISDSHIERGMENPAAPGACAPD
jgi:hypothetical protein